MTQKISDGFSKTMGMVLLFGTLSIATAAGNVIYNQLDRIRSQVPKECSGHAVEFKGRIYALPLENGTRKYLGEGITYVSPPAGTGYIHIAKRLGYPDPECYGRAMQNYNSKKSLKQGDIIAIPENPAARAGNQTRNQRELARP